MYTGALPHPASRDRAPARRRISFPAAAGALALLLAAACTDRTATGPELAPPAGAGPAAAFTCRADVRAGTVQCAPPAPSTPGSAAILGGQGLNVRLRSSGVSYDGTSTMRLDVTVENLTGQALGTADGVNPAPEGVRVFFTTGPTSSTGPVEVANPTGEAFFTAAGQKYFQYDGLLAPGDTTAPLEWRFAMGPEVQSFQFMVLVSAAVAREGGWLRMSPVMPSLAVGDSMPITVQRLDVAGRPVASGAITWTIADSTIARVTAEGIVTGVAPGQTRVSASSGGRTSSVVLHVRGTNGDLVAPTVHSVSVSPTRVTANGLDSVTISVRVTDGGTGTYNVFAILTSPSGAHRIVCHSFALSSGDAADATFTCTRPMRLHAESGAWRVSDLWIRDWAGNNAFGHWSLLQDAGSLPQVYVHSDTPDLEAPSVTGVSLSPDSIEANGLDIMTVAGQVADAGAGVASAELYFQKPDRRGIDWCRLETPSAGTRAAGTFLCRFSVPTGGQTGDWLLYGVRLDDAAGNVRQMDVADLDSAGFPTVLRVYGPPADTVPPTLAGFSFSPDTVGANGVDSVTVTMEVTDLGSSVQSGHTAFISPSGQKVMCRAERTGDPVPGTHTLTCRLAVAPGHETGEWKIDLVTLSDEAGNWNDEFAIELEALGFPTVLTVTP